MSNNKNKKINIPSFLEIYLAERKEIPKPGFFFKDKTKYDRNKLKKDFRNEVF